MSGWTGLLAVMARLLGTGFILIALVSAVVAALRHRARPPVLPALPQRRTGKELASILAEAASRPWSRDLAAERLRRLARDAVAARLGVDDRTAREIVDSGGWDADAALKAFLATDWLAQDRTTRRRTDFIREFENALDLLEEWSG